MVHQPIFKKSNDLETRHSYLFSATRIKSIGVRAGSYPFIYTKPHDPLLIDLLVGTCAVHNSIQWIYGHNPNLHLLHMSLCLFVSMIPPYLFACLHVFISWLFGFCRACLLCLVFLFVCLHVADGTCTLLPRGK